MHRRFRNRLSGVGHSDLSEALNKLKYESEALTLLAILDLIGEDLKKAGPLTIMDIGVGTGYWLDFMYEWCAKEKMSANFLALDISSEALKSVKERFPDVDVVNGNVGTIDLDRFSNAFDLVMSFYCLHHLVHFDQFYNALRFACRKVRSGGYLVIMDPILTRPFSHLDVIEFSSFKGNGVPRHLYLLDDVAMKEGLSRIGMQPAVSFLLNGNIEGNGYLGFVACRGIWNILKVLYRRESWTMRMGRMLLAWDRLLKRADLAFSSNICVYHKTG